MRSDRGPRVGLPLKGRPSRWRPLLLWSCCDPMRPAWLPLRLRLMLLQRSSRNSGRWRHRLQCCCSRRWALRRRPCHRCWCSGCPVPCCCCPCCCRCLPRGVGHKAADGIHASRGLVQPLAQSELELNFGGRRRWRSRRLRCWSRPAGAVECGLRMQRGKAGWGAARWRGTTWWHDRRLCRPCSRCRDSCAAVPCRHPSYTATLPSLAAPQQRDLQAGPKAYLTLIILPDQGQAQRSAVTQK